MNAHLFRAGLSALRASREATRRLAESMGVHPDTVAREHAGPWCWRREGNMMSSLYLVTDDGTEVHDADAPQVMGDTVAVAVWEGGCTVVFLRRDAEATGIEAQRMVERARGDE